MKQSELSSNTNSNLAKKHKNYKADTINTADNQKKKYKFLNNKAGSFSLEISLIFPFIIIIIFCFIWSMTVTRSEMFFRSVIIKETEKVSFLSVLSEYTTDLYEKSTGEAENEDVTGSVLNKIYELALKKQINEHYELLCVNNPTFHSIITNHIEFLEGDAFDDIIKLTSLYTIYTPFKVIEKQFTVPLTLWDHGDGSGKVNETVERNVWQYDNFERGKILRRRFGGNLPIGFPLLSGYMNGNALIIKSMDLTAKTWGSTIEVKIQMQDVVDNLAKYEGMPYPWGEKKIIIPINEIRSRFVKFIIPENTEMDKYEPVFNDIRNFGLTRNIQIEIIPYQTSIIKENQG